MTRLPRYVLFLVGLGLLAGPAYSLRAQAPAPPPDEALLRRLQADYEALLKEEKTPLPIRRAARLLKETNGSDRWTSYAGAVALLRKHRSRAAIPLLLRYMIEHATIGNGHIMIPEYADTLAILTGEDVATPLRGGGDRQAVEKWVTAWLAAKKQKFTVDPAKMTHAQRAVVVDRLLRKGAHSLRHKVGQRMSVSSVSYLLDDIFRPDREDWRAGWWKEDVHPALLPALLETAGYKADATKPGLPGKDLNELLPAAVPMLAVLRRSGSAPGLNKIALDAKQHSATRLTCLLALACAGEELNTKELVKILGSDPNVEHRVVAALALRQARNVKPALAALLKALDDPNEDVRTAAVHFLCAHPTKEALPKLKKILADAHPRQAVYPAIRATAAVRSKEAQAILASFLGDTLRNGNRSTYLLNALYGFQQATGQNWLEAGAHPEAYYQEKAKAALDWWGKQR